MKFNKPEDEGKGFEATGDKGIAFNTKGNIEMNINKPEDEGMRFEATGDKGIEFNTKGNDEMKFNKPEDEGKGFEATVDKGIAFNTKGNDEMKFNKPEDGGKGFEATVDKGIAFNTKGNGKMNIKKIIKKTVLIGPVMAALIGAGVLVGCTGGTGPEEERESGGVTTSQEVSERGGEGSGGEHGSGGEGSGSEGSGEGSESGSSGSEEASANMLAPDETFDMVRSGARLIMGYDAASNSFKGTVENTTNSTLTRVRIEVHLSNGVELGPTIPIDLAPGEVIAVDMAATAAPFTGWTPHAEVGSGEGGGSGESGEGSEGSGGEGSGEGSGGEGSGESGAEAGEAAMSSPIIPLGQTWNGNLGGLAVSARYDATTRSVQSVVENTLPEVLCYVQAEPHLKSGTQTVGELGPDVIGHLGPGEMGVTSVSVDTEPSLAGVSYDGYVVHLEVFDCAGTGPVPHTGGEGSGEGSGGEGSGGEGHGSGGEGSGEGSGGEGSGEGSESGSSGSEEASANMLAPDETFDTVRSGARLIMSYDAASNSFKGTVENTTNSTLTRVRIEVHLSNGTELGPTRPVDMAPGQVYSITMPATQASFTGWTPHAEVGSGEGGGSGESGEGSEGGSGEHGSGGEGSGEHGSGGEGSGGG